MISVLESSNRLKPFTFSDDYAILLDEGTDWAVAFIQEIVDTVFGLIVDAISELIDDFNYGIAAALSKCTSELASTGEVSIYSKSRVSEAFYGDLFWILMGVSALVSIALSAIVGLATVFGFLIGFAVSAITSVLIVDAIGLDAGYVTQAEDEIGDYASSVDDSGALAVGDMAIAMALEMDEEHETDPGLFWVVGSVFSWYGFMASMVSFFGFEAGGRIGYTSLAVGLVGAVIAIGSGISQELAIFGVLTGLAGLVFGIIGAINCQGTNMGGTICNSIGGISGFVGAVASSNSIRG